MKIVLPFPDMQLLHSHAKGNSHFSKSLATKRARELSHYIGLDMLNRSKCSRIVGPCCICYEIYVPDNRRRDTVNILQACKPYVDGIVSSGLVEDDCWQKMVLYNVDVAIDKEDPRVVINLHAIAAKGDLMAL